MMTRGCGSKTLPRPVTGGMKAPEKKKSVLVPPKEGIEICHVVPSGTGKADDNGGAISVIAPVCPIKSAGENRSLETLVYKFNAAVESKTKRSTTVLSISTRRENDCTKAGVESIICSPAKKRILPA